MRFLLPILSCVFLFSVAQSADFTVVNTNGSGPGSLYQAITDANATAGRDNIFFNIPGPGVHVIDVSNNPLPAITDPIIIDGYTQPGAHPNTASVGDDAVILIQIDNPLHTNVAHTGLILSAGTSIVRGLSITGFASEGIQIKSPGAASIVEGNFIGIAPDGQTLAGNAIGVAVETPGNRIGGSTPDARNVIAGTNNGVGMYVRAQPATISGNYIGTDASGTVPLGGSYVGVKVDSSLTGPITSGVVIGGTDPGAGNIISGTYAAVGLGDVISFLGHIFEAGASGVQVTGNLIGVASDRKTPLGNNSVGISIIVSSNTSVGGLEPGAGNLIAFNGGAGVAVSDSKSINNKILSNSIYGHGQGISIGAGANDPADADEGPNHLQNFPIITATSVSGNNLTIQGTLNSSRNTQFTIQLFADANDYQKPTRTFLGTTSATTDNNGDANFSATVPLPSGNITIDATATDPAGNTSEFFLRPSFFRNLSTRAFIQPGDAALIGGFIPSFSGGEIIVRAIGPSLAVNGVPVSGRLDDPTLEVYVNGRLISSNDNWRDDATVAAEVQKYGLAPASDLESAAVIYPGTGGQYTAIVRGKNNSTGIGLVEFYDVTGNYARPVNLSTRGLVQPGDNVMIGGFIAAGGYGNTAFVVRGIGPSLASFGISNPLADPLLELHDSNGVAIATNDNWQDSQETEINATGLAPTNPAESAILALLPAGSYTAIVRGKADGSGVALVEAYQLP
jgi:hypothetical protein